MLVVNYIAVHNLPLHFHCNYLPVLSMLLIGNFSARNSADFFKAFTRLLYLVKPCPSSSKTIYSIFIFLRLNLSTIWSDSFFTTLGSLAPCITSRLVV